uniref:RNA-directed RNA polymerase L n=1 Tax=Niviventer confucianus jeilongvirus TaxID=3049975 RepID=A0A9Y1Z4D6_9MONO|nr:RNA polymerase [Niviventer confucianus jeilongvirus]
MSYNYNLQDVLYPECHLNSPIVAGKLVTMIEYTRFPHQQKLDDAKIQANIASNIKRGVKSPVIISQIELRNEVIKYYPSQSNWIGVPYPLGNKELFRMEDSSVSSKLQPLLSYGHKCYLKISGRVVKLRDYVESRLGSSSVILEPERSRVSETIEKLPLFEESSKWYKPFMFWFSLKTIMRTILKKGVKKNSKISDRVKIIDTSDKFIAMNRNLLIIILKHNMHVHYLTFEMTLMLSDVIEGRLMIDIGLKTDPRLVDLRTRGHLLWSLVDNLFGNLGNNTYNIVALIEPLVLGFLQLKDESYILRGAFLKFCLLELKDEFIQLGYDNSDDISYIQEKIFEIFHVKDVHIIAEFFSFFRTFGHPILEATEAANKVRSHMNKAKLVDFKIMMKGHALFCAIIINGYRDRHGGAWPPLELPKHASPDIINARNNDEGITDELCILNWKSFVGLKFKCFLPLVLDDDLTMYMKDKALASPRSEWDALYPIEVINYPNPRPSVSRRLVEVFLEDSQFDPVNLINYVLSGEYLNDHEFNLSYSLKEKEIKRVGRLFAKMTYQMRACQVLAESLIATGIGKYFKENGIVKDEHELLKTLHKLSVSAVPRDNKIGKMSSTEHKRQVSNKAARERLQKLQAVGVSVRTPKQAKLNNHNQLNEYTHEDIAYETISTFLTTDLQKFCLNWRQETTNIFAQRLNEIYGLPNFFNWLHRRLEKSVLYVADPFCPPNCDQHLDLEDQPNNGLFIKYPMGGIEGYCQKLWTIITIPFLFLSAYETGTKIAAVVQGDNQAIAITKRVHPNLPYHEKKNQCVRVAQQYFNRLRHNLHGIGHHLKAHETIVSSHMFIYSKRIYYDGMVLSQSLKPLSRCVFWSETVVDETRSACSNISTAISKSIEQGFSRWVGYAISLLKTIEQIIISLKFTLNETMTEDVVHPIYNNPSWILAAALVPSQLGGFNYMNISRLYVRNIGDPVTTSIADVKRLITCRLLDESIIHKIMNQEPGDASYLDWSSDPYSINIPDVQSVTILLKNVTARHVLANSPNPMLNGLFHIDFEQEDRDLAQFLLDRPIIIPRAAHEIMDNSLTGARQEIAGMLDTTKGLIRNSLRLGGLRPRLVDKISLYDYNQFRIFNNLMKIRKYKLTIASSACSVRLAIALRKRMWFHLTHGRPIYGLEVPDIIEATEGYTISGSEDCYFCSLGSEEYCWLLVPRDCELDNVEKESNQMRVPYFGSSTEERSEIRLGNVRSASRALRAAIRIATVYTWAFGDTEKNWEEAWYLSSMRANVSLEELKAITPISTSNNIAHRLRDRSTQMKYSGTSINRVGRYVVISNDKLNFTVNGVKVDTNLVYQQIMLLGIAVLEDQYRYQRDTGPANRVLHLHIVTNCCVIEMTDHPYVESDLILPTLHQLVSNRLVYDDDPIIEKDKIVIQQQIYKQGSLFFPRWTLKDLDELLAQSLAATLIDIITKEDKDHLTEFKVLSGEDDINSLITEFLLVDPDKLALYIGLNISITWAYNLYYRRPEGKYQLLELLNTVLQITSRSYFAVLNNAFSHIRVFKRFWDAGLIEPIYGPNLMNQDYFRITVDFLVKSFYIYIDFWLDDDAIDYLISESQEDIIDHRFESVQAKHMAFLCCLYLSRQDMPRIKGLTAIEKGNALLAALTDGSMNWGSKINWHLEPLDVIIYPASMTYLRRGSIKHIRMRRSLMGDKSDILRDNIKVETLGVKVLSKSLEPNPITGLRSIPLNVILSGEFQKVARGVEDKKNLNSWEAHVSRRLGINSTSCYKALEIALELLPLVDTKGDRLFLGEGSGAMLSTYYFIWGQAKCYYNSGIFHETYIGQRVLEISPSEVHLVCKAAMIDNNLLGDLKVLFNGRPESTWVGNMECFQHIVNSIKLNSLSFIHSDIENTHSKDQAVVLNELCHVLSLILFLGKPDAISVIKIAPQMNDNTPQFLTVCQEYFNEVKVLLPSSSNPYSSEAYIACIHPKQLHVRSPGELWVKCLNTRFQYNYNLRDNILNVKVAEYLKIRWDYKRMGDYEESDLVNLNQNEKVLMSYGFQLNGPKLIYQVAQHDVGSGRNILRQIITSAFHHLKHELIDDRKADLFFSPYPLKKDSKIHLKLNDIANKIAIYILLYMKGPSYTIRRILIGRLRLKQLVVDLSHYDIRGLFGKSEKQLMHDHKIDGPIIQNLSTKEIKVWWKLVGYSLIHQED